MYTLGMDTIAGAKLLQLKFGSFGVFQPGQSVLHQDRRARFIGISDGAAVIRHWGDSHPVTVPPETLSLPPTQVNPSTPRRPARANAREAAAALRRRPLVGRMGLLPHHRPRP